MDLESAKQTIYSMGQVNPVDFTMQAKQYWEPIVKPLIEEGAQRFSDYFSALPQELLRRPSDTGYMSPEQAVADALRRVGRLGGLYEQNLGLRDYYNTRSEDLANLALRGFQTKYGMAQDLYNILFGEERARKEDAFRDRSLAAQYSSQAQTANLSKYIDELLKKFGPGTQNYGVGYLPSGAPNRAVGVAL